MPTEEEIQDYPEAQAYPVVNWTSPMNGQVRWLPKGDVLGQIQFIQEIFGLKAE